MKIKLRDAEGRILAGGRERSPMHVELISENGVTVTYKAIDTPRGPMLQVMSKIDDRPVAPRHPTLPTSGRRCLGGRLMPCQYDSDGDGDCPRCIPRSVR